MLFYIRKNGVTKTDYSVNSMLNGSIIKVGVRDRVYKKISKK
jgi:hypothetical protein